jgi:3-oxoacyl-[acyl-carrier-protein] synthase II
MSESVNHPRSVVITGVGLVSPIGMDPATYWSRLAGGISGIGAPGDRLRGARALCEGMVAGEIKEFDEKAARDYLPKNQRKNIKVMCRDIMMGASAAMLAVQDSGIDVEKTDHDRIGVDFGANLMFTVPDALQGPAVNSLDAEGNFDMSRWGTAGMPKMEPLWLLKYLPNMPACHIAIFVDSHGPSNSITQDEASGNLALMEAFRVLQRGAADVMIAGSTGARLHDLKTIHARLWGELGYYEPDPTASCRPFDVHRSGQVVAEGAASFIVETEEHANARGARIYGRILGGGSSCVSTGQQPNLRQAIGNSLRKALLSAGVSTEQIGHINAHGVGSVESDLAEAQAIHDVFGPRGAAVPVTSTKGHLGNSGAGTASLDLAASLLGLQKGLIPPTLHCDDPDPQCNLNIVREPTRAESGIVLNVNFTRFGQASSLIVQVDQ